MLIKCGKNVFDIDHNLALYEMLMFILIKRYTRERNRYKLGSAWKY